MALKSFAECPFPFLSGQQIVHILEEHGKLKWCIWHMTTTHPFFVRYWNYSPYLVETPSGSRGQHKSKTWTKENQGSNHFAMRWGYFLSERQTVGRVFLTMTNAPILRAIKSNRLICNSCGGNYPLPKSTFQRAYTLKRQPPNEKKVVKEQHSTVVALYLFGKLRLPKSYYHIWLRAAPLIRSKLCRLLGFSVKPKCIPCKLVKRHGNYP